jgi:hypothetical protein
MFYTRSTRLFLFFSFSSVSSRTSFFICYLLSAILLLDHLYKIYLSMQNDLRLRTEDCRLLTFHPSVAGQVFLFLVFHPSVAGQAFSSVICCPLFCCWRHLYKIYQSMLCDLRLRTEDCRLLTFHFSLFIYTSLPEDIFLLYKVCKV